MFRAGSLPFICLLHLRLMHVNYHFCYFLLKNAGSFPSVSTGQELSHTTCNFIDVHPHSEPAFSHGVFLSVDWIFEWRDGLEDGVHSMAGFLIRPAASSRARFVGHRPGAELQWQANRHLWFEGGYGSLILVV